MTIELAALDVALQATGLDTVLAAFAAVDEAGDATAGKAAGTIPFSAPGAAEVTAAVSNAVAVLDALGISSKQAAAGVAAVSVADRDLTNAQAILARAGIEVEAVTKAETSALLGQANAARAAAVALLETSRASSALRAAPGVTFRGGEPPRSAPPVTFRTGGEEPPISGALRTPPPVTFRSGGGGEPPVPPSPLESPEADDAAAESSTRLAGAYGLLSKQLLELVAAFEAYRAIRDVIATGVDFNAQIETSRLGIAAITQALGTFTDASGRAATGQAALADGLELADSVIQALQADAIKTAVPMQDLVRLFQGVAGAGLKAGASVDQIRQLTTAAALTATALGTPYEQLNTTLVQLLDGHVRITNQLVAHLGLTSQEVKQWKEQGTLVENLLATFNKFGVIGQQVQGTFRGISAEMRNAFDILSGAITRGFLTEIETGLRSALGSVLDLTTGAISSSLSGLVSLVSEGLAGAGKLVAEAINAAVRGAQELSQWFDQNRDTAEQFGKNLLTVVEDTGSILANVTKIAVELTAWVVDSPIIQGAVRAIADAIGFIADHATAIGVIGGGFAVLRFVIAPLAGELAAAAFAGEGLVAVLGAIFSPVTIAIAAISALVIGIGALNNANDEAAKRQNDARNAAVATGKSAAELTGEYRQLAQEIASGKLTDDQKKEAQEQLKTVTEELIKISPDYQAAVSAERGTILDQANAVAQLTEKRLADLVAQRDAAKATVDELTARQAMLQATIAELGKEGADEDAFRGTQQELDRTTVQLQAATKGYYDLAQGVDAAQRALSTPAHVFTPTTAPAETGNKAGVADAEAAAQIIGAAVDAEKEKLKAALDQGQLSYRQYFDALTAVEIASLDAQIRAKQAALAAADKPDERIKTQGEIAKLEEQEATLRIKNAEALRQKEQANADALIKDDARVRAAHGETYAADLAAIGRIVEAHDLEMAKAGASDDQRRASNQELLAAFTAQLDIKNDQQRVEIGLNALAHERATLESQVRAGLVPEQQAEAQLAAIEAARLPGLKQLAQQALALAEALGDPKAVAQAQALLEKIEQVSNQGNALGRLRDQFNRIMAEIEASATKTAAAIAHKLSAAFSGQDLTPAMVSYAQKLAQAAANADAAFADASAEIGQAIANGIVTGLTKGGNFLKNFGGAVLAGIGQVFDQVGQALISYGSIMTALAPFLSNPFTAGPAALAAGIALETLGKLMEAAFQGQSGAGATSPFSSGAQTINIALPGGVGGGGASLPVTQPPAVTPGAAKVPIVGQKPQTPTGSIGASAATLSTASMPVVQIVTLGRWSPEMQRDAMREIRIAMRRGL